MRVERCWFCVNTTTTLLVLESEVNVLGWGDGKTERATVSIILQFMSSCALSVYLT